ncbi:hypothetical protein N0V90_012600 [Kalmusia sp. IMI 367209]|nr:hypothetical protein N0V90_012600 [Kalmusia sp. IMI 367209]
MYRASLSLLAGLSFVPTTFSAPTASSATLLAAHYTGKLYTLTFTSTGTTGSLTVSSPVTGCGSTPAWLELYPDDKTLYCFDEAWTGSGTMASFSVGSDGKLTLKSQAKTTGNDVHGLFTKPLQLEKFSLSKPGPNSRQDVPHPHETLLDPTGKFILVPDLGADLIRIFSIDATSGKLTACGSGQAGAGDGPRHGSFFWTNPNSTQPQILYTLNELGNSVSSWTITYPSTAGGCLALNKLQTLSTYAPGTKGGPTTKAAELRTFGNFLYAANRADQTFGSQKDSIATYTIDPATGKITWLEAVNANAYYPRTFQINKAGTLVAVGGQTSSNVAILNRDPATGKLGSLVASVQVATAGRAGEEDGLAAVIWNE